MKHIPQLDSLRGIAVLMVLVGHIAKDAPALHLNPIAHFCFAGVDLFFVLSGFLITSILLSAKGSEHFLGNFYIKRALRIWPLYFGVLALWFGLTLVAPALHRSIFAQTHPQWAYFLWLQNFLVPDTGTFGPLQITWSLCVEEHFYLVWPLLVLFCERKWLIRIASAAVVVSTVTRLGTDVSLWHLDTYQNTLCRLDAIACGCLVALLQFSNVSAARKMVVAAVGLIVAGSLFRVADTLYVLGCGLLYAGLLVIAKESDHGFWKNRFLLHTGKISYGLYMLHLIAFDSLRPMFHSHTVRSDLLFAVLAIAGAFAIAEASWNLYESQILRLKKSLAPAAQKALAVHA